MVLLRPSANSQRLEKILYIYLLCFFVLFYSYRVEFCCFRFSHSPLIDEDDDEEDEAKEPMMNEAFGKKYFIGVKNITVLKSPLNSEWKKEVA